MAKKRKGSSTFALDKRILPRVQEVVDNAKGEYLDADDVANFLKHAYAEYRRKPHNGLVRSVEKALETISEREKNGDCSGEDQALHEAEMRHRKKMKSSEDEDDDEDDDNDSVVGQPLNPDAREREKGRERSKLKNGKGGDDSSEDEINADVELMNVKDSGALNAMMRNMIAQPGSDTPSRIPSAVAAKARALTSTPTSSATKRRTSKKGGRRSARTGGFDTKLEVPTVTYSDIGGIEAILQDVRELVEYPLTHPEIYKHLGVNPPAGVLLHGPPGCGKTLLANAIAGELKVPFMKISAPEIVSGMSGESEEKVRKLFADALENAPCILFIDEIDAITPKRQNAQREMERRIVAQLLTSMDTMAQKAAEMGKPVIVIGATNRPDSLDPALRRAGRFDREIAIGIPDENARARILEVMCRKLTLQGDFDYRAITRQTAGYVGADLAALTKEAAVLAVTRIFRDVVTGGAASAPSSSFSAFSSSTPSSSTSTSNQLAMVPEEETEEKDSNAMETEETVTPLTVSNTEEEEPLTEAALALKEKEFKAREDLRHRGLISEHLRSHTAPLTEEQLAPLCITMADFFEAVKKVQPSSKREGFATVPDVNWEDIGALDVLREELSMSILQPIRNPEQFDAIGLTVPAGVLLYGPPGCGKTLVAKAIANESGASFLSIKGPELLNQYVGASERAVRQVFQRAQSSAPCVIFFDELDALCPKRGKGSEGSQVSERVVNQLLTEMDGLDERRRVFVIAATNRPDIIDPAMLRPGRLEKLLYVKLPNAEDRLSILEKHVKRTPMDASVDLRAIASSHKAEGYSGADLASLVREAVLFALREKQAEAIAKGTSSPDAVLRVLVTSQHFQLAFDKVLPSVSEFQRRRYDRMGAKLRGARSVLFEEGQADAAAKEDADAANGSEPLADPSSV